MNKMPIAHAIQWAAQWATYNGHEVIYNKRELDRYTAQERQRVLSS